MTGLNKLFQQKIFRRFGTVTFVAVIALLSLAVSVQAAQLTVSESVSASRQAAALAFWTRARIAAAPALALPVDRSAGGIDAAVLYEPEVIGPGSSSPPGAADPNAAQAARAIFWQDWMALEAEDEPALDEPALDEPADEMAGTRGVYTFYDVNRTSALWNIFPHKWDGKFTFTTPSGGASCSATVISGNNIVTAAHCVYDTPSRNQFYTNKIFTPAYRNGSAPFGTFATTTCSVLTAWVSLSGGFSINTWSRHDVAVCTLGRNALGQTINQAVGWAGRLWNAGNNQLVFNSGYPALNYADGSISNPAQYLRACTAETFLQTTQTLGGGCFWGRGISGGSLLVNYKPFVVSGNVNSVNSGLFIGQQNLYGARFNSNNIVPLCNARRC